MKQLLSGTEPQRSYLDRNNTQHPLTYGQLDAFLLKWLKGEHCSQETLKSIKFSKSSKYKALQMRVTGQLLSNYQISSQPSLNGKAFLCLNTPKTQMNTVLTCLLAWQLWSHIREFLVEWLCNTLTSMTLIRANQQRSIDHSYELIQFNISHQRTCSPITVTVIDELLFSMALLINF